MFNKIKSKITKTLQSLIKFFTNASLTIDDWKWAKRDNQEADMSTRKGDKSGDFIDIYNYYPLNYYANLQSSKSSKTKNNSWDSENLVSLSSSMGNAFSVNLKGDPDKNGQN